MKSFQNSNLTCLKAPEKLRQHHGTDVKPRFLGYPSHEIARRAVQRRKDSGCKFRLAYFRPASG